MRYFFDVNDQYQVDRDDQGTDCKTLDVMKVEAKRILCRIAFDEATASEGFRLSIGVRDEHGRQVYNCVLRFSEGSPESD